ncbi:MAG: hypothetical protein F4138_02290 [Acidimicrobiia bacterium]|nr:hypothetical protein [Acidimicrobiia bacterium]
MAPTRVLLYWVMLLFVGLSTPLAAQHNPTSSQPKAHLNTQPSPQDASLHLLSQSIWLAEQEQFEITFKAEGHSDGLPVANSASLDLILGVPVRSRAAFQDRLIEPPNTLIWQQINGLEIPNPNNSGASTLRLRTVKSFTTNTTNGSPPLLLPDAGVYPLSIILRATDGTVLDTIHTFLIHLPSNDEISTPLLVATALSAGGPLAVNPQNNVNLGTTEATLQTLVDVLSPRDPHQMPITTAIEPHLIDALAISNQPQHAVLLTQLLQATVNRQITANTYVPIDSDSWIAQNLSLEIGWQMEAGTRVLTEELNNRPDHTTMMLSTSATPELLQRLKSERVELVLVPDTLLDPSEQPATTSARTSFYLRTPDDTIEALAIDSMVTANLAASPYDSAPNPYITAAALAAHWFEDPQQVRGVIINPPLSASSDAQSVGTLLDEIVASPILSLVSPSTIAERLPPTTLRQVLPANENTFGEDYKAALNGGQQIARSYQNMVDPITAINTPGRTLIDTLQRALLLSGAYGLTEIERDAYLAVVAQTVRDTVAAIEPPSQQRINLTSKTESIPILIRNHLDQDVIVRLDLNSDKLDFPEGSSLLQQLSPGINQVQVQVRAKTSGDTILKVNVNSPDGLLNLGKSQLTIRATSLSGAGVAIAAAALIILALWWIRHWRVRRASNLIP